MSRFIIYYGNEDCSFDIWEEILANIWPNPFLGRTGGQTQSINHFQRNGSDRCDDVMSKKYDPIHSIHSTHTFVCHVASFLEQRGKIRMCQIMRLLETVLRRGCTYPSSLLQLAFPIHD